MVKVVIAGSRTIVDYNVVTHAMRASGLVPTEIVSGGARGVDWLGEQWAATRGLPIRRFPADWIIGRHAGFLRNTDMAEYADALVAVWDGNSRGTAHMIEAMRKRGKRVFVWRTAA